MLAWSPGTQTGKTTFAALFENFAINVAYEDFKKSPFWQAFYLNPGKYIFETEISFALLHYHQIKKAIEQNHAKIICDFSFLLDLAYAKIGLFGSKLKTFEAVLNEIQNELPRPDLYVYLQCDAETQLERIENRKRPEESLISIEFLQSLNSALKFEVDKIEKSKVITVNSTEKDFAHLASVQVEIVDLIKNTLSI